VPSLADGQREPPENSPAPKSALSERGSPPEILPFPYRFLKTLPSPVTLV
jgi:hypothetical protein